MSERDSLGHNEKLQEGADPLNQIYSDVLQFRGSHYDFGYKQGNLLKNSLTVENREKQWKIRKPHFVIEESEVKQALEPFAPRIWDELRGLGDALEWSTSDVLHEFGGYRLAYMPSGCSVYTGTDFMVRNYDYHPKTYEGRFTVFQPSDGGYAVIGPSQRITGRMDGMNEKGLVMGYNFTHRKKPGDGFICSMIGRIVLERSANVEEALDLLERIPHRHSFSYVVFDPSGKSFVVEATPRGVTVREANACTNHFEEMTHENRHHLDDSFARMNTIERQRETIHNGYDAFRLFNDTDKGIFSEQYKQWAGTIHTSLYFPREKMMGFALGGDRDPFVFNFDTWLRGENFVTTRVLGNVNTDLSFLHMDTNVK